MEKKQEEHVKPEEQTEQPEQQEETVAEVADEPETAIEGKQQADEMLQRLQRLQADFDNYRKRTVREKEDFAAFAEAALVKGLLPILDNFDRALSSLPESEAAWADGIKLVQRQLMTVLEQQGMTLIDSLGQPFDPNLHEAVMRDDQADAEDGTILAELQKGYMYKGRLLRPSMVKVAVKS